MSFNRAYLEGWGRPTSLLARPGKSSRRRGLAQGHPSSSKTWGAAPPGGQRVSPHQVSPGPSGHCKGTRCPENWSLRSCLPCHLLGNRARGQQPHAGAWAAPALRGAGAASVCACTCKSCCMHTNASPHTEPVQQAPGQLVQGQLCPSDPAFAC